MHRKLKGLSSLYDRSTGHTKKHTDELDVKYMNVDWGGSKGINMRTTKIKEKDGCLGPYHDPEDPWMLNKCLSRDVIATTLVRKFSRRARGCMETYVALDMNAENKMKDTPIPHRKIEQLKEVLKAD